MSSLQSAQFSLSLAEEQHRLELNTSAICRMSHAHASRPAEILLSFATWILKVSLEIFSASIDSSPMRSASYQEVETYFQGSSQGWDD